MKDDFNDDFFEDNEINELIRVFEKKIKDNESFFFDVDEYELLIDYYIEKENYKYISHLLNLASEQHPSSTSILLKKAQYFAYNDKNDKALEILTQLEKIDPSNVDVLFTKGAIYSNLQRYEKAIEEYKKALSKVDELDEVYINIAYEYQFLGNYEKAIEYFNKAFELTQDESIFPELSLCYEIIDKNDKIAEFFLKYIEDNPYSYKAWFYLGTAYNLLGLYEKAIEAFDFSIAIDDKKPEAYYSKAITLFQNDKYAEAIKVYSELIDIDDNKGLVYYYLGECYEKLTDFEKAIYYYTLSINHDEYFDEAWLGRGICYFELRMNIQAINDIKKAISLNDSNSDYKLILAEILFTENKFDEAIDLYEKVITVDPQNANAWLDYSDALRANSQIKNAISVIMKGLENIPNETELLYRLAAYQLLDFQYETAQLTLLLSYESDKTLLFEFFDYLNDLKLTVKQQYFIEEVKKMYT
jgi:tetratricopeptide (TPR) repeat protein